MFKLERSLKLDLISIICIGFTLIAMIISCIIIVSSALYFIAGSLLVFLLIISTFSALLLIYASYAAIWGSSRSKYFLSFLYLIFDVINLLHGLSLLSIRSKFQEDFRDLWINANISESANDKKDLIEHYYKCCGYDTPESYLRKCVEKSDTCKNVLTTVINSINATVGSFCLIIFVIITFIFIVSCVDAKKMKKEEIQKPNEVPDRFVHPAIYGFSE